MNSKCAFLPVLLLAACTQPTAEVTPPTELQTWGSMREALKQGRSEGRVTLTEVVSPTSIGVGALAELQGEVTIIGGQIFIAESSADVLGGRSASAQDQATLLVLADVHKWQSFPIQCTDYASLESAIAGVLTEAGFDLSEPTPFKVNGMSSQVNLHVIAGACPIANPSGPKPFRYQSEAEEVTLVGFFAEGAAGKLTHHNRRSHVHALISGKQVSGHLDEIALAPGATLWIPVK